MTWSRPALPIHAGCGSWQNWRYKIFISESSGSYESYESSRISGSSEGSGGSGNTERFGISGISESESFLFIPEPDSIYRVVVQPVSDGGDGPPSEHVTSARLNIFFLSASLSQSLSEERD